MRPHSGSVLPCRPPAQGRDMSRPYNARSRPVDEAPVAGATIRGLWSPPSPTRDRGSTLRSPDRKQRRLVQKRRVLQDQLSSGAYSSSSFSTVSRSAAGRCSSDRWTPAAA